MLPIPPTVSEGKDGANGAVALTSISSCSSGSTGSISSQGTDGHTGQGCVRGNIDRQATDQGHFRNRWMLWQTSEADVAGGRSVGEVGLTSERTNTADTDSASSKVSAVDASAQSIGSGSASCGGCISRSISRSQARETGIQSQRRWRCRR